MTGTLTSRVARSRTSVCPLSWLLLTGLLLLRMSLIAQAPFFLGATARWLSPLYEVGSYAFSAMLIWVERDRLSDFHIDRLAIVLLVVSKPVETLLLGSQGSIGVSLAIWTIAVGLAVAMWRRGPKLPAISKASVRWLVVGACAGILTAVVLAYPMSLQISGAHTGFSARLLMRPMSLLSIFLGIVYQLGYAAASEEPLFRGFLWGCLRKVGWRDGWILWFQAGLFMLAHLYYMISLPISFWVIVPVGALVMGVLAWRSRTIASSMAAHACLNGVCYIFGRIAASWRT